MEFSYKLFILVLLLPIIGRCSAHFSHYECNKEYDISSNHMLKQTIGQLISDLSVTTESSHAVLSRTVNSVTIYGLTQCRGDTNLKTCSGCILEATREIKKKCPYSAAGQVWRDECIVRYDSDYFFGKVDTSYSQFWVSIKPAPNSVDFERSVNIAMGAAKFEAITTANRFGEKSYNISNSGLIVYGMAQCTGDLDQVPCGQCIDSLEAVRSTRCKGRLGCRVIGRNCFERNEVYKFSP